MRSLATVQSVKSNLLVLAIPIGVCGCGESFERQLVLEAAQAACTAVLQHHFGPQSEDKPILMDHVPNSSTDEQKFEFAWKPQQISALSNLYGLMEEKLPPPDAGSVTRELHVDSFICRGSVKERSMFGLWTREITLRGQFNEIPLTKFAISF